MTTHVPEDGFTEVLGVLRDMGRAMDDSRPAPAPVEGDDLPRKMRATAVTLRALEVSGCADWCDAAAAEITALRERVAELEDVLQSYLGTYTREKECAEAAEADAARLRGVIDRYADHDRDCAYAVSLKLGCDCGFDAAMSERK
jgi:hypothetical protein